MFNTASKGMTKGGFNKSATKGRTKAVTKSTMGTGTKSIGSVKGLKKGLSSMKGRTSQVTKTTTGAKGTAAIGSTKGVRVKKPSTPKSRSGVAYTPIQQGDWKSNFNK